VGFGFFVPFFALLTHPGKRSRGVVAAVCLLMLISRIADKWWLVLPEFRPAGPFWLAAAAILAIGGLILLPFIWGLRSPGAVRRALIHSWKTHHG
jgi:hypothetical protein